MHNTHTQTHARACAHIYTHEVLPFKHSPF